MKKVYTTLFLGSKRDDFLNFLESLQINGKIELLSRGEYSVCNIDFTDNPNYYKLKSILDKKQKEFM